MTRATWVLKRVEERYVVIIAYYVKLTFIFKYLYFFCFNDISVRRAFFFEWIVLIGGIHYG